MTKRFYLLLGLLLPLAAPVQAAESLNDAMKECASIKRDLKRLACFDRLSGNVTDYAIESMSASQQAGQATNVAERNAVATAPVINSPTSQFGLETRSSAADIDTMTSTIPGEFAGLKKDDEFTLANGQTWKVIDSASLYKRTTNPRVVITSGVFGSYRIQVADLNKTLKVRRVN